MSMRGLGLVMALALIVLNGSARASNNDALTPDQREVGVLITASTEVGWLRSVCPGYLKAEIARRDAAARTGEPHPMPLAATRCEKALKGEQPEVTATPD